jgi:uncharacterized coiled-coil protein SlyX
VDIGRLEERIDELSERLAWVEGVAEVAGTMVSDRLDEVAALAVELREIAAALQPQR